MKITFHIGAQETDKDALLRGLIRSNAKLAQEGIYIPGPSRYRKLLSDAASRLQGAVANAETEDLLLDSILDTTEADHIVLSNENFICAANMIFSEGGYYRKLGYKAKWLRQCFPSHRAGFAIGIRNPATQIPAIFDTLKEVSYRDFVAGCDPLKARWSDALKLLVAENPGCPVTVWCNEDTPLIWPEVMREVSGHDPETRLKGGFDILGTIMETEGMKRLRAYLQTHPPQNEIQRRRILAAFLDKYAIDDRIEEVVDLPGWTEDLIDEMTETYEDDLLEVARIPGVQFIAP